MKSRFPVPTSIEDERATILLSFQVHGASPCEQQLDPDKKNALPYPRLLRGPRSPSLPRAGGRQGTRGALGFVGVVQNLVFRAGARERRDAPPERYLSRRPSLRVVRERRIRCRG